MVRPVGSVPSSEKKSNAITLWLLVILLVAAVLRLYHYSTFSFSNDELSAINRLRFNTFAELVKGGFYVDGHPGGIQVFLWYISRWFGNTEVVLRFPFVLFGILAVLFSFLVARRLFGAVAGLFTAASLTFLEFPLLYSQIARPYGSGLFFCLLMVFFWLKVVFPVESQQKLKRNDYLNLTGYIFSIELCLYNHYFSFLFALIVGLTGFIFVRRKKLLAYASSGLIAAMLFLPHLSITINHLTYKGVGLWLGKPGLGWIPEHISFIFNNSVFMLLLFAGTSVLLSWKGKSYRIIPSAHWLALAWFLIPILIGYFYSLFVSPVLQNSVLIFSFPFLIMVLFLAAGNELSRFHQFILAFFILAGVFATVGIGRYYQKQHFGEFKKVAEVTRDWETSFQADSIEKVVVANSPYYLDYYFDREGYSTRFSLYDIRDESDFSALSQLLRDSHKPYFLYAWTKPAPEGVEDMIRSYFPYIVRSIHFGNLSNITLYGKRAGHELETEMKYSVLRKETLKVQPDVGGQIHGATCNEQPLPGDNCLVLDSLTEYSKGIEIEMKEFEKEEAILIRSTAKIRPSVVPCGALLVVSLESKQGKPIRWEASQVDRVAKAGVWNRIIHSMYIQGSECKNARLKVYVWNNGKANLIMSDLEMTIYRIGRHSPFSEEPFEWSSE